MRIYEVKMAGTDWKPELPTFDKLNNLLEEVKQVKNDTERIITLMCSLMKMQLFNDGNKRTGMLVANHELIRCGRGLISISNKNKVEFGTKLIQYYEKEEKLEELKTFIYDKCLEGVTVP